MKQLVYALLPTKEAAQVDPSGESPDGPLVLVTGGPLTAACSRPSEPPAVPSVPVLLDFARRVEGLFSRVTVLPFRYGCWLDGEREIRQLLARNEAAFVASLQLVQGCVELELSLLPKPMDSGRQPAEAGAAASESRVLPPDTAPQVPTPQQGTRYLQSRRQRYAEQDGRKEAFDERAQSIQSALTGLFVTSVAEQHAARQGGLWSLYFLVRRNDQARFRRAFQVLQGSLEEKLLLSGPWPPYNFVSAKISGATT